MKTCIKLCVKKRNNKIYSTTQYSLQSYLQAFKYNNNKGNKTKMN